MTYEPSAFSIEAGQGLVMFSDERLAETLSRADDSTATWIATAMASSETDDDVTIVRLRRP